MDATVQTLGLPLQPEEVSVAEQTNMHYLMVLVSLALQQMEVQGKDQVADAAVPLLPRGLRLPKFVTLATLQSKYL